MIQTQIMLRSFLFIFICFSIAANAQKVQLKIKKDAAYFTEGKDSILSYQIAEKSLNGIATRCHYIHPLFGLDGEILTEDFPADHLHHRGVFWAWHQVYVGDKRLGDSWELKDFRWDIISVEELKGLGAARGIKTEVFWKSNLWVDADGNEKRVVKEVSTIKVYPAEKTYRQIDISIALLALVPNVQLGGSEDKKGYGGFSVRMRLPENIRFTGSTGSIQAKKTPVPSENWMDFSGALGKDGAEAGLSILCHPQNPKPSNQWILRSKNSMQNAVYPFPGATAVPISQTQPTVLRYRLLVHDRKFKTKDLKTLFDSYSDTVKK